MFNINKYRLQEEEGGGEGGSGGGSGEGMMGGNPAGGEGGSNDGANAWSYAENIAGEGDRPDWFKEKYNSVEAQAKAYNDLEGRFGGFTGSPDEFKTPEGFGEGEAAIMAQTIQEIAKDSNMNQETYNKILEGVSTNIEGYRETYKQDQMEAAIKEIPNFETRRTALADTVQASLTTEQFNGLNSLMSSRDGFEAVEALATIIRGGSLPGNQAAATPRSAGEIFKELNSLDQTDMSGRNKLLEELNKGSNGAGKLV